MVYLLKIVIFHGELLNNQMVNHPQTGSWISKRYTGEEWSHQNGRTCFSIWVPLPTKSRCMSSLKLTCRKWKHIRLLRDLETEDHPAKSLWYPRVWFSLWIPVIHHYVTIISFFCHGGIDRSLLHWTAQFGSPRHLLHAKMWPSQRLISAVLE